MLKGELVKRRKRSQGVDFGQNLSNIKARGSVGSRSLLLSQQANRVHLSRKGRGWNSLGNFPPGRLFSSPGKIFASTIKISAFGKEEAYYQTRLARSIILL